MNKLKTQWIVREIKKKSLVRKLRGWTAKIKKGA